MVTAVPNVNVALELFDEKPRAGTHVMVYRALAKVDDQPIGSELPEVMDDVVLRPGNYYVLVGDKRRASESGVLRPRENSSDAYSLTVELSDVDPLGEVEVDRAIEQIGSLEPARPRSSALPVFGHAGGYAPRETAAAVGQTLWSDDHYDFKLSRGAKHACALLSGVPAARLFVWLGAPMGGAPPPPSTVEPDAVVRVCAAASESLPVHVGISAGAQYDVPYALVVIDDGEGGLEGVKLAAARLRATDRPALAQALEAQAQVKIEVERARSARRKAAQ
jgi:hypothetical protein